MENKCELIKDLLPLYIDGLCSDYTKSIVEEHIADCKDCKYLLNTLKEQGKTLVNAQTEKEKLNPLKKIRRRNRMITIFSIICAILIASFVYVKLYQIGSTAPTSAITVNDIVMFDDGMTFSLELSSNTKNMRIINSVGAREGNYTSFLKGDQAGKVFVKANHVLAWPFYSNGSYKMTFGFDQGGLGSDRIKAIYLVGKDENDIKLIWEAK